MSTLLELEGIAVQMGGRAVLQGVDLRVERGEVVGLLGRNGAGKTTLLRVASGTLQPTSGRIRLEGLEIDALSSRGLARRVAVVPQETRFPFAFRVAEVALMGRTPHLGWLGFEGAGERARAQQALARMGIAELADRSVLEISGGERQLAIVARALVQDAPLLLLDEPTAFLDLRHRLEVLDVVRERAGQGCGALVVSHDLTLAARACDRVALLAEGRVLANGAPGEVLTPERLRAAFGVDADVLDGPDGRPIVLPHTPAEC